MKYKTMRRCVCGCGKLFICNEQCNALKGDLESCYYTKCVDNVSWDGCKQILIKGFIFR